LFSIPLRDKEVYYVKANGENYVLIKPICDVFELDSDSHIKDLKKDEIFGPRRCEHTVQLPTDSQSRRYIGLPETMIYGWLLGIKFTNTMSDDTKDYLIEYKKECYQVLYNHFHGRVTEADTQLKEKVRLENELRKLKNELFGESEKYKSICEKEIQLKIIGNPYTRYGNKRKKDIKEDLFSDTKEKRESETEA